MGPRQAPRTLTIVSTYLKGLLIFFPGYLVILIFRRIFGFSYDGFLLYLSFLLRDHLVPVLAAVGGFLLLQRTLDLLRQGGGQFLAVFAYMAGFMTLLNIADALRTWGSWDTYVLFLFPLLRMSHGAWRGARWPGAFTAGKAGTRPSSAPRRRACAVALTFASFLYGTSRVTWSILLTAAFFLAACVVVAFRFPRVLRGRLRRSVLPRQDPRAEYPHQGLCVDALLRRAARWKRPGSVESVMRTM